MSPIYTQSNFLGNVYGYRQAMALNIDQCILITVNF